MAAIPTPSIFFDKDIGVLLKFTIQKADGTAQDLTGGTVTMLATGMDGTALSFSCTITDAAGGKVQRQVAANDFASGTYRTQLRFTAGGSTFHTDIFNLQVSATVS